MITIFCAKKIVLSKKQLNNKTDRILTVGFIVAKLVYILSKEKRINMVKIVTPKASSEARQRAHKLIEKFLIFNV